MSDLAEIVARAMYDAGLPADLSCATAMAHAALASLAEAGYVIVPREPTEEMLRAGREERADLFSSRYCWHIWCAMVEAAGR